MKTIDVVENLAVALAILASCMISFFAKDANFVVVFSMFLVSALALAVTSTIKNQWAIMRLQTFFVLVNTFALVKEII